MNTNRAVKAVLLISSVILAAMFGLVGYKVFTTAALSTQEPVRSMQESATNKTLVRGTPEYCQVFSEDDQCPQPPKPQLSKAQKKREWDEAVRAEKESQAAARHDFATRKQHELWLAGYECSLEARGTTLYLEYVLAGRAMAYQMQKLIVEPYQSQLRDMGFKKVVLSDGYEHDFYWNL
jgi:hypothetical protein